MTASGSMPHITTGDLTRAAASALTGAALSVERHLRVARTVGLLVSGGLGTWVAVSATGAVPRPAEGTEAGEELGALGPAAGAALGVGAFALMAGASELGLRGQRGLERWAVRTNGHPRLTVGVLSGALSLVIDVAQRSAGR